MNRDELEKKVYDELVIQIDLGVSCAKDILKIALLDEEYKAYEILFTHYFFYSDFRDFPLWVFNKARGNDRLEELFEFLKYQGSQVD